MENGQQRKLGKTFRGVVCSDKMDKTVTVSVTRKVQHPVYKKFITRTKKYHAHDEKNACKAGDVVLIVEAPPYSKLKRWRVAEIVEGNRE